VHFFLRGSCLYAGGAEFQSKDDFKVEGSPLRHGSAVMIEGIEVYQILMHCVI